MFDAPMTLEEARKYRYNQWAGNPNGRSYVEGRCAYELFEGHSHMFYQCSNKNGRGVNGLYCGIHAKKVQPPKENFTMTNFDCEPREPR